MMNKYSYYTCVLSFIAAMFIFAAASYATPDSEHSPSFEATVRVVDSGTLLAGKTPLFLWGVESVDVADPVIKLKARTTLANAIGNNPVYCEKKENTERGLKVQCVNKNDLDLGLFMLQQGYVTVDRAAVYGTVFENAYINGEMQAQDQSLGIWGKSAKESPLQSHYDSALLLGLSFAVFVCVIVAFIVLSIVIMRGFRNVTQAQKDNLHMMMKERQLRDKERRIIAAMIEAEIKANKSKIEAYLVVYEEMLSALKKQGADHRYRQTGDIIQSHPLLDRSVFDRNTDRLDMMGRKLSSDLIHFYARIKSNTEYINIEPETDVEYVIETLNQAVKKAQNLNQIAESLIKDLEKTGAGKPINPES